MSKPIPIPKKSQSLFTGEDEYSSKSCPGHYSTDAIMVYPGFYPNTPGIITRVTANYNSYNSLCAIIGRHPMSVSLQYTPPDSIKCNVLDNFYHYILYYDAEAQKNKKSIEYNQIISQFTNREFWGRVMIIDENIGHPVIKTLDRDITKHSI